MTFRAQRLSWMLVAGIAVSGCECGIPIGEDLRDAGRDAGTFRPRTDECGNGIDDDRNGRIDDGCSCGQGDMQSCFSGDYPGHGVGACRNGVQTCAVQEFGDWGAFSCTGETLPSAELCDGIDNDCDGARDEDCPCEVGATRSCSDEFTIAPCMPGRQTCRGGTWTRCEGAVGPTADVCSDAIDNDCDGLTNEGCTCVSSPEQCNDRIDNDCDGEVDEVTCAPLPDGGMSLPDAGVPLPDSGACVSQPELCNGLDDDCDRSVDEGACASCACERWTAQTAGVVLSSESLGWTMNSAFDGEGTVGVISTTSVEGPTRVTLVALDGHVVSRSEIAAHNVFIAFLAGRFVLLWTEGGMIRGATVSATGVVGTPRDLGAASGEVRAVTVAGSGELYAIVSDTRHEVWRMDRDLAPIGAAIPLPADFAPSAYGFTMRAVGDAVGIVGTSTPGTTVRWVLLRGSVVAASEVVGSASAGTLAVRTAVASSGIGKALVCFSGGTFVSCRFMSIATGAAMSPAFIADPDFRGGLGWDLVYAGCAYELIFGVGQPRDGVLWSVHEIDEAGSITTSRVDSQYDRSDLNTAFFRSSAGALIRVTNAGVSRLVCGPLTEEPSCAAIRERTCGLACRGTGICRAPLVNDCEIATPSTQTTLSRSECLSAPCDGIDRRACWAALDEAQRCGPLGAYLVPASCAF